MSKFEESKKAGVHAQLARLTGTWEGVTKTYFEPGKLADESPMKGTMRPVLDGRFILHEYKGTLSGKPFEGMAIIGYNIGSGVFESAWVDSFHMSTGIMFSEGAAGDRLVSVLGSYGASGMSERWGWRTEIQMDSDNKIIISAYNISPDGQEALATETVYNRL